MPKKGTMQKNIKDWQPLERFVFPRNLITKITNYAQINVVDLGDEIMFMSCFTWFEKSGAANASSRASKYTPLRPQSCVHNWSGLFSRLVFISGD